MSDHQNPFDRVAEDALGVRLLGPAWPMLFIEQETDLKRAADAIARAWYEQLRALPTHVLASQSALRITEAYQACVVSGTDRDTATCFGGFEKLFWLKMAPSQIAFFGLSSAAYAALLHDTLVTRAWPDIDETTRADMLATHRAWRSPGPQQLAAVYRDKLKDAFGSYALVAAHLLGPAIWVEKNYAEALSLLDDLENRQSLQPDLPAWREILTYLRACLIAIVHGPKAGATYLADVDESSLLLYLRVRLLAEGSEASEGADVLLTLVQQDPAYLLRFAADYTGRPAVLAAVLEKVRRRAEELREQLVLWQRSLDDNLDPASPFGKLVSLMKMTAAEDYPVLAAEHMRQIALHLGEQEPYKPGAAFEQAVVNLREFASEMPSSLPLRIGGSDLSRFCHGREETEMQRVEKILAQTRLTREEAAYVTEVAERLPASVRFCLLEYSDILIRTMMNVIQVLPSGNPQEAAMRNRLVTWAQHCQRTAGLLEQIPQTAGKQLAKTAEAAWIELQKVEVAWSKFCVKRFGHLRIEVPKQTIQVSRARGWQSFSVQVVDVSGRPAVAVPVLWETDARIASAKDGSPYLAIEWATSLDMGAAFLTLVLAPKAQPGTKAAIRVWALGSQEHYTVNYEVVD